MSQNSCHKRSCACSSGYTSGSAVMLDHEVDCDAGGE